MEEPAGGVYKHGALRLGEVCDARAERRGVAAVASISIKEAALAVATSTPHGETTRDVASATASNDAAKITDGLHGGIVAISGAATAGQTKTSRVQTVPATASRER